MSPTGVAHHCSTSGTPRSPAPPPTWCGARNRRYDKDVTLTDVLALASGAALTADAENARRLVALLRTGLAAPNGGRADD
jgi:hypothetical protein